MRWKRAEGTMVSPGEFIPLFEKDGLIVRLDEYVFRKVCSIQGGTYKIREKDTSDFGESVTCQYPLR